MTCYSCRRNDNKQQWTHRHSARGTANKPRSTRASAGHASSPPLHNRWALWYVIHAIRPSGNVTKLGDVSKLYFLVCELDDVGFVKYGRSIQRCGRSIPRCKKKKKL